MGVSNVLGSGRLTGRQIVIIALMVGLNALDGFDVLSISFAAPSIAADWNIGLATLGWILSMELVGMAIGSILLGNLADRWGRRPTILGCLCLMVIGMYLASLSTTVPQLLVCRLLTGLGIGGILAAINAMTAEFSNDRWRGLAISLMVVGYPIGGMLGGFAVKAMLGAGESWQMIFEVGAIVTLVFIPFIYFLVPESVVYLESKGGPGALAKINKTLGKFGLPLIEKLAPPSVGSAKGSIAALFGPNIRSITILLTVAYFFHITAFYYVLKWVPKIVVDLGFAPASAAGVLAWANMGGALGCVLFGVLVGRLGPKQLTIAMLLLSAVAIAWLGGGSDSLMGLSIIVLIAGFATNSAIAGLYSLFAYSFPTELRASGTGLVIGFGRGGAALAPVTAGYMLESGLTLQSVSIAMGAASLAGALVLLALKVRKTD